MTANDKLRRLREFILKVTPKHHEGGGKHIEGQRAALDRVLYEVDALLAEPEEPAQAVGELVEAAEALIAVDESNRKWVMPLAMVRPLDRLRAAIARVRGVSP